MLGVPAGTTVTGELEEAPALVTWPPSKERGSWRDVGGCYPQAVLTSLSAGGSPCVSRPCLNNGSCQDTIRGYTCTCAPGYDGRDCAFGEHRPAPRPASAPPRPPPPASATPSPAPGMSRRRPVVTRLSAGNHTL